MWYENHLFEYYLNITIAYQILLMINYINFCVNVTLVLLQHKSKRSIPHLRYFYLGDRLKPQTLDCLNIISISMVAARENCG